MRQSPARDALRRLQDIIAEVTGAALPREAEKRVQAVLEALADRDATRDEGFSHQDVTILLADLRGFMALTATHPAGTVLTLLNRCFGRMSEIIVGHGGVIDKFMGDAVLAVFRGGPREPGEDARRAVHCALDMQVALDTLNRSHRDAGLPAVYMGVGINTGTVLAGLVGSALYSAYTVIGEDVNLASRIEAFSLRGQVLISDATWRHCEGFAAAADPFDVYVKGRSKRVRVRELLALPALGKTLPRQEVRRSPRVEAQLPMRYQLVQNKIVRPAVHRGCVLDIGYYGVLAELEDELPLRAELKLDLELPLVAHRATELYARVVKLAAHQGAPRAGLEFTSLAAETTSKLQLFVQMLVQARAA